MARGRRAGGRCSGRDRHSRRSDTADPSSTASLHSIGNRVRRVRASLHAGMARAADWIWLLGAAAVAYAAQGAADGREAHFAVLGGHAAGPGSAAAAAAALARRRRLQQGAPLPPPPALGSAIKKCLWSESLGCALNPSFMFTVPGEPDSYERWGGGGRAGARRRARGSQICHAPRPGARTLRPPGAPPTPPVLPSRAPAAASCSRSPPCATRASRTRARRSATPTCAAGAAGGPPAASCRTTTQSERRGGACCAAWHLAQAHAGPCTRAQLRGLWSAAHLRRPPSTQLCGAAAVELRRARVRRLAAGGRRALQL
jgi:hypothetical protein